MQKNKEIAIFLILLLSMFLLSGCSIPREPVKVVLPTYHAEMKQSGSVEKRFQESAPQGRTAVESAIELSKKCVELSEEKAALQQKTKDFVAENRRLKDQNAVLGSQLQQTQKELTEANDLLIEMRIELNNWKTDILGFRDEMRDAEKAQLEALLKILNILGGEIPRTKTDAGPATALSNEPSRLKSQQAQTSGE